MHMGVHPEDKQEIGFDDRYQYVTPYDHMIDGLHVNWYWHNIAQISTHEAPRYFITMTS